MASGVKGAQNGRDVVINGTLKIDPVSDVFSHPSILNKTHQNSFADEAEMSDDEQYPDINNTVIEIEAGAELGAI